MKYIRIQDMKSITHIQLSGDITIIGEKIFEIMQSIMRTQISLKSYIKLQTIQLTNIDIFNIGVYNTKKFNVNACLMKEHQFVASSLFLTMPFCAPLNGC